MIRAMKFHGSILELCSFHDRAGSDDECRVRYSFSSSVDLLTGRNGHPCVSKGLVLVVVRIVIEWSDACEGVS